MAKTPDPQTVTASSGKSATAFRTISEVAEELNLPPHVLRFWESKFVQVKPLKRGGGRRYYRREDIDLLRRIRDFLYTDGYTIKGVQKLLRPGRAKEELEAPQKSAGVRSIQAGVEVNLEPETSSNPLQKERLDAVLAELEEARILLHKTLA